MAEVAPKKKGRRGGKNNAVGTGAEAAVAQETYMASAKALGMEEVLRRVMPLVGKGHHVFIATVCREWGNLYSAAHPSAETSLPSVVKSVKRVQWAKECGYELSVSTFKAAAEYGDVSVCEELHGMECSWDEEVYTSAVRNARHGLHILKWLRSDDLFGEEHCLSSERGISREAGKCGYVEVVEWLLSDEFEGPPHAEMWDEAVKAGHIPVLNMLVQHPKVRAQMEAGGEGSFWRPAPWPFLAARKGNLEVLQWLHANARELCRWDAHVCYGAVRYAKSLSMLKWLRSEEVLCPWDRGACPQILRDNYLVRWDITSTAFEEMKQWVHANGRPCSCQD